MLLPKLRLIFDKFWPSLFVAFIVVVLFGQTLFPPQNKILYGGDIQEAYYYWKSYLQTSILSGTIPFWNPYNYSGTPFLAHPFISIFYPPKWLFLIFKVNQAFSFYLFIHFLFAAFSMYYLSKQYTNRFGSIVSSLIFILSGYFAARIYAGHPEYIDAASWVPLVFALNQRAIVFFSKKNTFWAAVSLAMLLLAGNALFFLFVMELIGLYFLYHYFLENRKRLSLTKFFQTSLALILTVVFSFGLSAVSILPRFEFMSLSIRSQGISYGLAGTGSMPIKGLMLFIKPFYYGLPFDNNYSYIGPWPNLFEYTYYVGIIPIAIIFIYLLYLLLQKIIKNIVQLKVDKEINFFLFIVIPTFIIISLGVNLKPNIHEYLWRFIPFYKTIRFPARHLFLVTFSLSLVSGIILGNIKNKLLQFTVIFLICIDLLPFSKKFFRLVNLPTTQFDQQLISTLKKDASLYRLLPDYSVVSQVRKDFEFGAATLYQIQSTSDYNSMILSSYYHFIDLANRSYSSSTNYFNVEIPPLSPVSPYIDFLNIKYILADRYHDAVASLSKDKYKLILSADRYNLYQNLTVMPRFFTVNHAIVFKNQKEIEKDLLDYKYNLAENVLLLLSDNSTPRSMVIDCNDVFKGDISIIEYKANSIKIKTNTNCNSFLTSSEVYYPGWQAKIDNMNTKIFQSNFSFRTIFLPKGEHLVRYYYQPNIYIIGAGISLFSLVLSFVIIRQNKNG